MPRRKIIAFHLNVTQNTHLTGQLVSTYFGRNLYESVKNHGHFSHPLFMHKSISFLRKGERHFCLSVKSVTFACVCMWCVPPYACACLCV